MTNYLKSEKRITTTTTLQFVPNLQIFWKIPGDVQEHEEESFSLYIVAQPCRHAESNFTALGKLQ